MADPNLTVDMRQVEREQMQRIAREADEAWERPWREELSAVAHMTAADLLRQTVVPSAQDSVLAQIADFTRDRAHLFSQPNAETLALAYVREDPQERLTATIEQLTTVARATISAVEQLTAAVRVLAAKEKHYDQA